MKRRIYLDNSASTPLDPRVKQAIEDELTFSLTNPSSPHKYGQEARGRLDAARRQVAAYFKVKPQEVVFTSSGTEAMNFLIHSFASKYPGKILTSEAEHSCVYNLLKKNPQSVFLKGTPTLEEVEKALSSDIALIVLMAVNNETGVKIDLKGIASLAERKKIPFIVDGVAWLGKDKIDLPAGVSAIGFSSHKVHAPTGLGCAIVRHPYKGIPLLIGGAQEFGLRGGTENMLGIRGFAEALNLIEEHDFQKIRELRDYFEEELKKVFPAITINGSDRDRIGNISNVLFPDVDGETLLMNLDQAGVACSLGSACTSGALEPSRVLISMGLSYKEAKSSLRFSFGRFNTKADIDDTLSILKNLIA